MTFLAGDIGGTKTLLALCHFEGKKLVFGKKEKYPSQDFSSLEQIIEKFVSKEKIEVATFGIAGPVVKGECRATNLPWDIKEKDIQKKFSIPTVQLFNDLVANAYGIETLEEKDFHVLRPGKEEKANRVLVSAGTGLGISPIFYDGKEWIPSPSEGGHADFAPRNQVEIELFSMLAKKYGHVSYERALSGMGFGDLYDFFVKEKKMKERDDVQRAFQKEPVRGKVIIEWAKKGDPVCVEVMKLFSSLYGAQCSNMALCIYALGGVFLGGGIAPKIIDWLEKGGFISSFIEKGRFKEFLQQIGIKIILNEETALRGAALACKKRKTT